MIIQIGIIECITLIEGVTSAVGFKGEYYDQQTHVWEVGGSQLITNQVQQFPANWSAIGAGHVTTTTETMTGTQVHTQIRKAHWKRIPAQKPAPLQVRLSGNTIVVSSASSSVGLPDGIHGSEQLTIDGQPQTPGNWKLESYALLPLPPI